MISRSPGNRVKSREKATPNQALSLKILKQGCSIGVASGMLSPPVGYTGGCLSAVERPTGPVFWQLRRVHVCAGTG